jgi:hypothetical protein
MMMDDLWKSWSDMTGRSWKLTDEGAGNIKGALCCACAASLCFSTLPRLGGCNNEKLYNKFPKRTKIRIGRLSEAATPTHLSPIVILLTLPCQDSIGRQLAPVLAPFIIGPSP